MNVSQVPSGPHAGDASGSGVWVTRSRLSPATSSSQTSPEAITASLRPSGETATSVSTPSTSPMRVTCGYVKNFPLWAAHHDEKHHGSHNRHGNQERHNRWSHASMLAENLAGPSRLKGAGAGSLKL